ncbi:cell wall hydrolase [Alloiococcus sp. CFN-8]|uniref:cell wall hydrolase n=1 Tax=Alloiococcus sp. CFN-8 TaxID=3416081 RepID=UPI003CFB2C3B
MKKQNYALILKGVIIALTLGFTPKAEAKILTTDFSNTLEIDYYNHSEGDRATISTKESSQDSVKLYQEINETVQVFSCASSSRKVYVSNNDIELMSRVVFRESRGEPYEGKIAVASVILNRALNPQFPSTIEGVICQKNAFSCVKNGQISATPDESCYKAVRDALQGIDPTGEALFFYNPRTSTSSWMINTAKENQITIGNHVFFKK